MRVSDILHFKLPYWLITFNCLFFYAGYFSLMNVVSELMQRRYAINAENCGFLMGIPYFIAALASPVTGLLVDTIGKRPLVICLSNFMMIVGFVIFIILPQNDDPH